MRAHIHRAHMSALSAFHPIAFLLNLLDENVHNVHEKGKKYSSNRG